MQIMHGMFCMNLRFSLEIRKVAGRQFAQEESINQNLEILEREGYSQKKLALCLKTHKIEVIYFFMES
jgi:uncharacterized membrane-anchored protein